MPPVTDAKVAEAVEKAVNDKLHVKGAALAVGLTADESALRNAVAGRYAVGRRSRYQERHSCRRSCAGESASSCYYGQALRAGTEEAEAEPQGRHR